MAEEQVAAPAVTEGSVTKGVLAGIVATVVGMPSLGVSFFIALFVRRSILGKLMGREIESEEIMREDSTAFFAEIVLAVATGLIAAGLATLLVLMFVKNVRRSSFIAVGSAGFAVIGAAIYLWVSHRYPGHNVSQGFDIGLGWLGAVVGLYLGALINAEGVLEAEAEGEKGAE